MDSPKVYLNGLKTLLTLILIISLTLFPSNSGLASTKDGKGVKQKKLVLGSRPPKCVNKCLNCRPCMAALVISPHHKVGHIYKATTAQRDEGYYLLSWKCKCAAIVVAYRNLKPRFQRTWRPHDLCFSNRKRLAMLQNLASINWVKMNQR